MADTAFPSLIIRADGFTPQGSFAEAQAEFLRPDPSAVTELGRLLRDKNVGVVAHFYMDPELQGVLTACDWPHIQISDSLAMADRAIQMVEAGVRSVLVLGVDFMSENVRAMLDASGHDQVPVYRVTAEAIGCSLAESAEKPGYEAWLRQARETPRSVHVVYINTSLHTKAMAHAIVPTITCTSSNVVQTVLTAAAQIEDVNVWYGPDTYMGRNLRDMLGTFADMDDEAIRRLHPAHDRASVRSLLHRFHYYEQGICIVHHMFGESVARRVRRDHPDAHVTAHLEVPGEMFALGLEAQREGRGVVGSTSNILGFIGDRISEATRGTSDQRLSFVLGTEAGMITAIVERVQRVLRDAATRNGPSVEAEIIFPVAGEAIAQTDDPSFSVVPGVAAGEGCSVEGGCATCPYMKMNSLDALLGVLGRIDVVPGATLAPLFPRTYDETIAGRTAADLGGEPILHMRHLQKTGRLPAALVDDVMHRTGSAEVEANRRG